MPTSKDFNMELHRMMHEAVDQGKETADINAGELQRRVGDYLHLFSSAWCAVSPKNWKT